MITLGLIGLGSWGKNYLNTVKKLRNIRIKYICAKSRLTLSQFSGEFQKTTNYRDLTNPDELDGVIIATPPATHYKIASEFIGKRIPVLVEKPFTTNLVDAIKLQQAAYKNKSPAMVGHIYLYHPAIIKMKQLLPRLGRLYYIETQGGNFGPFRDGVSVLWDWAPHDVSLCLYLTGKEPVNIQSWGQRCSINETEADNVQLRMDFPGRIATYSSIGRMFPIKKRSITINGAKGVVIFNDLKKNKLVQYNFQDYEVLKDKKILRPTYPKYDDIQPLQAELTAFCSYIRKRIQPVADLVQAVKVTKIIESAEKQLSDF